jgi:lambda repressor-like predicted transcriptional regulator
MMAHRPRPSRSRHRLPASPGALSAPHTPPSPDQACAARRYPVWRGAATRRDGRDSSDIFPYVFFQYIGIFFVAFCLICAHTLQEEIFMLRNNLQALLEEYDITLRAVSRDTGLDYSCLYNWAANRTPMPYHDLIVVADYLKVAPLRILPWFADRIPPEEVKPYLNRLQERPKLGRRYKKKENAATAAFSQAS